MRNYAKFCKINLNNKKYQLNLTETGADDAHLFNKMLSVLSLSSPVFILYKLGQIFFFNFKFGFFNIDWISHILAGCVVALAFVIPLFESGKGFNLILRNILLKNKTKKYYKKMRNLEMDKMHLNYKIQNKKQQKVTKRFLSKLVKITKRNSRLKKKYVKILNKKGYVDGIKGFVNDNLETLQESVDKFVFHNKELLLKLCPKYKTFIQERYNERFNVIINDGNYYDEYIWSASHSNDNLIKNNCLNKGETSNYLQELKQLFSLDDLDVKTQIKYSPYNEKANEKTNKTKGIKTETTNYSIYENIEKELNFN